MQAQMELRVHPCVYKWAHVILGDNTRKSRKWVTVTWMPNSLQKSPPSKTPCKAAV